MKTTIQLSTQVTLIILTRPNWLRSTTFHSFPRSLVLAPSTDNDHRATTNKRSHFDHYHLFFNQQPTVQSLHTPFVAPQLLLQLNNYSSLIWGWSQWLSKIIINYENSHNHWLITNHRYPPPLLAWLGFISSSHRWFISVSGCRFYQPQHSLTHSHCTTSNLGLLSARLLALHWLVTAVDWAILCAATPTTSLNTSTISHTNLNNWPTAQQQQQLPINDDDDYHQQ